MPTVLSNGVIVPDVGSTNWASDLETNWTLLNALIGAVGANVRLDRPNIWTAAQTFSNGIYGDLDGTAAMAVSDANGNEIATTYALKTDVTALANTVASKAADNAVVHLAGAETITGDKTFAGAVLNDGFYEKAQKTAIDVRTNPSANQSSDVIKIWSGAQSTRGDYLGGISFAQFGDGSLRLQLICFGYPVSGNPYQHRVNLRSYRDGSCDFYPETNNDINLGISSAKWKTLNGINPGALSLPRNSAYVDILSSITHTDWIVNYYTPAINGYIALHVNGCAIIQPYGTYGIGAGFYDDTVRINDLRVCLPVIANQTYEIWVLGTVNEARLFACQGNV